MSRRATLAARLSAAALVPVALSVTPAPAHAAVAIDCSAGPVTLTESTEDYVLTGACSTVTVGASNVTVELAGAARMDISGANVRVTSTGTIDALVLTEAVSTVRAPRTGSVIVRSSNVRLRIPRLDTVKLIGSNNTVRATRGTVAKVQGSNNRLVYTRLGTLVVKGANNVAKVRKGATTVTVDGANNVIQVNKRLDP